MNAMELRDALAASGIACEVEARGRLAVLSGVPLGTLLSRRRDVVSLARRHGFSHVAIEQ
jgi:hypothetical protein